MSIGLSWSAKRDMVTKALSNDATTGEAMPISGYQGPTGSISVGGNGIGNLQLLIIATVILGGIFIFKRK